VRGEIKPRDCERVVVWLEEENKEKKTGISAMGEKTTKSGKTLFI
jgi:hypothetical protein